MPFDNEHPGKIEFPGRPGIVGAEGSDVCRCQLEFFRPECVAERRHKSGEGARGSAGVRDRIPVGIGFPYGEIAVGEIGERQIEADLAYRSTPAVGTVATGACSAIDLSGLCGGISEKSKCRGKQEESKKRVVQEFSGVLAFRSSYLGD